MTTSSQSELRQDQSICCEALSFVSPLTPTRHTNTEPNLTSQQSVNSASHSDGQLLVQTSRDNQNLGLHSSTSPNFEGQSGDKKKSKTKSASKKKKMGSKIENDNNNRSDDADKCHSQPQPSNATKPRSLVEELKLFQNNHLLNQQDPIRQLHIQLNELIRDDDKAKLQPSLSTAQSVVQQKINDLDNHLSVMQQQQQLVITRDSIGTYDNSENIFTVKKGVLWQQQNYDKFHQRLFSRWKKRYFILTTGYLVCFKRSSPKVGRSEMGKFLYKISLSDVTKVEWLKPRKSDKGAIILHINGQFNLFIWSKENLEEWMFMIDESIERNKIRRSCLMQNGAKRTIKIPSSLNQFDRDGLYENTTGISACDDVRQTLKPTINDTSSTEPSSNKKEDNNIKILYDRSQTITKYSKNGAHPSLDVITKLRSQRNSASKTRDEEPNLTSDVLKSNGTNDVKVNSLSQSVESPGNERENLIERDHCKDNINEFNRVDNVQANKIDQNFIVVSDPSYDASICAKSSNKLEHSSNKAELGTKDESSQISIDCPKQNQMCNDLSSDSDHRPVVDGSTNSIVDITTGIKVVGLNKIDIVTPNKRSNRRRLNAKTACEESGIEDDTCNNNIERKNKLDNFERRNSAALDNENGTEKVQHTMIGNEKAKPLPSTNLIRRDDSWQSLVSLTRVGKVSLTAMQVAQRSLYAQHIMPDQNGEDNQHNRQNMINIESTITPSRTPLLRQQSMQPSSQRKLRPFPPIDSHAASFDLPANNSSLQANQQSISYQQKLLQLQLLHNSNNVDYIRHNGDITSENQIYESESTANHYGYSSMRSNLKSATSEFSFIRPSSSSHNQSTLPHQNPSCFMLDNRSTLHQPVRSSLILSNKTSNIQQSDSNNNSISCFSPVTKQFLANPMTGERIINNQSTTKGTKDHLMVCEFAPPMRELPLKPNKKRILNNQGNNINGPNLPKSSSLTSSIACFFRRAFSRRSKRRGFKKCSKLAESCSSSMGAFEESFTNVPVVPSAFSTGSKSVDGRNNLNSNNNQRVVQSQRMVDMIEAFTNKTHSANNNTTQHESTHEEDSQEYSDGFNIDIDVTPKVASQLKNTLNHFGSPLHKSNSISATMGLSLADANNRRTFLYDNKMMASGGASPLLLRSTKVMSANLTPLMSQRDSVEGSHNQFFLSPRNSSRHDHLPRPSSIYGQPSMISSPVINIEDRNNFGAHRNSLHNHHFRDRNHNSGFEIRRHQMMKTPFLDTTREVAEEISSPTSEFRVHDFVYVQARDNLLRNNQFEQSPVSQYLSKRDNFDIISASPSSGKLQHRQAVVSPILQSPTMNTIYDNHPMLNGAELSSYSYYNNNNQLLLNNNHQQQSPSMCISKLSNSITQFLPIELSSSPIALEDQYSHKINVSNKITQIHTPSRQRLCADTGRSVAMEMMNKKPSAIVPSTPNHNYRNDLNLMTSPVLDQSGNRYHTQSILQPSRSPMLSRRIQNQTPYQQSPLVSLQTRVLNKGDGIQATIIGDRDGSCRVGQSVINIAGAPGINLEPSLAASLLRGTNIDAYESSTFDSIAPGQSESNSKTFLVSTRLSKSMAYSQSSSNDNGSISSRVKDVNPITSSNTKTFLKSSKDELSSSGSRNVNSSIGCGSLRTKVSNIGTNSSQEDQQEESSGSDTHGRESIKLRNEIHLHNKTSSRSSRRKKRESSSEPSDEVTSQVDSLDKPEERDWITSKLVD